jgi:CRISPR-associated protein Cas4
MVLLILLLVCSAAYVALSAWSRRQRRQLGLLPGRIKAADDSRLGSATLRSERLGLAARPDHVVEIGSMRVPVEQKPSAQRVWPSHTLQVAAQCALLEETSGVRPSHGVLVLANAHQERVPFTPGLERELAQTMDRMRDILESGHAPGQCWSRAKCGACGYRQICWGADLPVGFAAPAPATR